MTPVTIFALKRCSGRPDLQLLEGGLWCYPELFIRSGLGWLIDFFVCFNATFSNISAISWRPVLAVEYPERITYPGQATGKLYHLFVNYKAKREILLKMVLKHEKSNQSITRNFCLIIKSLNTDGEQFQKYQQSKHPSLITYHWPQRRTQYTAL